MDGAVVSMDGSFLLDWIKLFETKPRRIRRFYSEIDLIVKGALKAFKEQRANN